jgi:hypothetical protein
MGQILVIGSTWSIVAQESLLAEKTKSVRHNAITEIFDQSWLLGSRRGEFLIAACCGFELSDGFGPMWLDAGEFAKKTTALAW